MRIPAFTRGAVLLGALLAAPAAAQARPAADTLPGLWREGGNAAGLATAGLTGEGRIRFGTGAAGGELRRPQAPGSRGYGGIAAGADREAGGWTMLGAFAYTRGVDRDVRWSNVSDPYGGSPYVWADSTGGTWHRDDVRLRAAIGSPAGRRLAAGLAVEYGVGQGARRNDPAPLFRRRALALVPGVAWRIAPRHTIGLSATAAWDREDGEIGFGSAQDPFVYHLRGLGTFDRTQLLSAARTTTGRRLGAGLQYEGAAGGWTLGAAASGAFHRDSVRDGVATPVYGGGFARRTGELRASALRAADGTSLEVRAAGTVARGEGTDPVFRAVNVVDEDWSGRIGVAAWGGRSRSVAPLRLSLAAGARSLARRDIVARTEWRVTALEVDASAAVRRPWLGTVVQAEARGGWSHPLRSSFTSGSESPLVPVLVQPDYAVHAAAVARAGASLRAELPAGVAVGVDADGAVVATSRVENPASGGRGQLSLFLEIVR